jgi:exonuclease VII small subunit
MTEEVKKKLNEKLAQAVQLVDDVKDEVDTHMNDLPEDEEDRTKREQEAYDTFQDVVDQLENVSGDLSGICL